VQTVIETPAFLASAQQEGVSEDELNTIKTVIAEKPDIGEIMPGTGGARKVRFAGRGKGKSGGYRVVTFFGGTDMPVFLLDIFGKGSKANLTKAERNELQLILMRLPQEWRDKQKKVGAQAEAHIPHLTNRKSRHEDSRSSYRKKEDAPQSDFAGCQRGARLCSRRSGLAALPDSRSLGGRRGKAEA
jgi:hypothetical protein